MSVLSSVRIAPIFRTLLVIVFVAAPVTALAHEFEHVLHKHEAPCALHVAADHLSMVTAPVPPLEMPPVPMAGEPSSPQNVRRPLRARSTDARAPPRHA
jgi:hypothetical protein